MKKTLQIALMVVSACLMLAMGIPLHNSDAAPRTVIMELMTATWCVYCPQAEEAMYNLAAQYGPNQVAAIEYHATSGGDPYGTTETAARISWYNTTGYPTMFFDGYDAVVGGGVPMEPYYTPKINSHLAIPASMTIQNTGNIGTTSGTLNVHIEVESVEYQNVVLRMALMEDGLSYQGHNYNYVCRDILREEPLTITGAGQTFDITCNFSVSPSWNSANMKVITFVQYDGNKHILQSAMGFYVPPIFELTTWEVNPPVVIPANGGSFQYYINITNLTTTPQTFQVWNKVRTSNYTYYNVWGPVSRSLPGNANPTRILTQTIASTIPAGQHTFLTYIGTYPSTVLDSSYFGITKLAVGNGGPTISESNCYGNFLEDEIPQVATAPARFELIGNYPNPFNPTTAISYQLSALSLVNLSVYDVSGKKVAELVNGMREAGSHSVNFDASGLTSGIYVYRLMASDQVASGKMLLIK